MGLRIYFSPWVKRFRDWCWNTEEPGSRFARIPDAVDVLVTHQPPANHLDSEVGCEALKRRVQQVNPVLHIFGH